MSGKLIVIEGSDGVGKQTQVELLSLYCRERLIPHAVFDFPQYQASMFGAMCKEYLHGSYGDPKQISPYLAALPYAADRWSVKNEMEQALGEKKLVFVNRYTPSNALYQAARLPESKRATFIEWVGNLEYEAFGLPREDVVIFLQLPLAFSQKLIASRGQVQDGNENDPELLSIVQQLYEQQCQRIPHWVRIECAGKGTVLSKEDIHILVQNKLRERGIL